MTLAFVFVNCGLDQSSAVEKAVKDVQGVLEANLTTGIYDLILKVQADDENKLEEVIKRIKTISGVTSTMTSIIYKANSFATSTTSKQ
jgi:DNA-binding Lrp family transcriptional regulator